MANDLKADGFRRYFEARNGYAWPTPGTAPTDGQSDWSFVMFETIADYLDGKLAPQSRVAIGNDDPAWRAGMRETIDANYRDFWTALRGLETPTD